MRVTLTGWNGFLATKLREHTEIEWTEDLNTDVLVLMGSPVFTDAELGIHDAQVLHQYVRETIKIIDRFEGHIIFASTTGVNDIQLDHKGSTSYNLAKLYLENYLLYEADSSAVLRIGTVVSDKPSDIAMMKPDRIQPMMLNDIMPKEWDDEYLLVEDFVNTTIEAIITKKTGIVEYPLVKMSLIDLKRITK